MAIDCDTPGMGVAAASIIMATREIRIRSPLGLMSRPASASELRTGRSSKGLPALTRSNLATASMTRRLALSVTTPKTVNPPSWLSRLLALLLLRLKNHWLLAVFWSAVVAGLPSTARAMARVPRVLLSLNSFWTLPLLAMASTPLAGVTLNPPPCTMKPGIERWKKVVSQEPSLAYLVKLPAVLGACLV